ncbi:MAG: hypothetical protein A3A80_04450 [Candidatus Terrybacteria bacterium RIFCSPLOWO2_01_FULL_44_24]|uniref:PsbP C-terminal domain-containing protein n=1 Tax=Candidatus Terrybacteria bacterium RIFCSPHIGHO2_01_FULL_43_35 TaxID=1802361 RepID=A0A1G2PC26_9BACT|nr:MAG: hypothetical protein A2828_01325 [Candidatus Terrybacteria bacterium RIFCSPHIGHO2_01_FULL_43_35]OHA49671.1 MAG: hypothetical protein A3B75_01105 [Candidatus Terrybacteria bacterium RIFCSPHIGHO2_02_FULL_43_14]OHA51336.1 MAG: hypothetical protein A3A80_04450 [Candidatus Terrybacteria bacterium RIFCSPLOWO2_01_FULL_44_24]
MIITKVQIGIAVGGLATAALILGGGGYVLWQENKKASEMLRVAQDKQTEAEQKAQNNTELGDISDWKTYRNEKYGFEFMYPNDWNIDSGSTQIYKDLYVVINPPISLKGHTNGISISSIAEYNNQTLDEILAVICKSDKIECIKNQNGVYYSRVSSTNAYGQYVLIASIPIEKQLVMFEEELGDNESAKSINVSIENIFDQILSTFKFIE